MNYTLPTALESKCLNLLGASNLHQVSFVGGGDINKARLLQTDKGNFFIKMNRGQEAARMFEIEASGLDLLASADCLSTPQVIAHGIEDGWAFLLMEYIPKGYRKDGFWEKFGLSLATLHKNSNSAFGLEVNNYIGSLPQSNNWQKTWAAFYVKERLEPQFKMAFDVGKLYASDIKIAERLYAQIPEICPEENPSLIHGDLWSGNFLVGPNSEPVIIDPSVSYAHREMDLAMSRLFGGFDRTFYRSYEEVFPLAPGFEQRLPVYQLYYLLVHVNLFGGGYVGSVRSILNQFN